MGRVPGAFGPCDPRSSRTRLGAHRYALSSRKLSRFVRARAPPGAGCTCCTDLPPRSLGHPPEEPPLQGRTHMLHRPSTRATVTTLAAAAVLVGGAQLTSYAATGH